MSTAHLLSIGILLILSVLLYLHRHKPYMQSFGRYALICLLILSEVSFLAWTVLSGIWDVRFHLPAQLCTISLFICIYMLITRQSFIFEIVYFFGLAGALQAIITPDLFYTFPHYRFFHFFIAHAAIILAILYMAWVEKYPITWKSALKSFAALNVIALLVFFINVLTGANYMFLAHKPVGPSILDFLGPYPWYIFQLEFIALFMYGLLYVPFLLVKQPSHQKQGAD
ncbi:TIGR02206 family membrane protein [Alkalihalophilus marmarensis]|uniref:YwaF family protein n=1 Tax=Alkalihalophilus marmarensis TaxID=521377 RepID=UPI0004CFCF23|nr:TIGR02206 family membrane protein [Alkalihalophilus marmarensis]MCM3488279.1 TIGR02206 family membrane protein [Alkalihalophilus marmarensis]